MTKPELVPTDQTLTEAQALLVHPQVSEALSLVRTRGLAGDPFEILGLGGTGLLLRSQSKDGAPVVIKIPRYGGKNTNRDAILRHGIRKEAEILKEARSPYLPSLLDEDASGRFLIRSYAPGHSLDVVMSRGSRCPDPPDPAIVIGTLLRLAQGLFDTFHHSALGCYVIRDLKPRNLILTSDERLTFVDVGSTRSECSMTSRSYNTERVGSGRWLYWAPEQLLERRQQLDRRADYFSLGATAFFVLFGVAPYENRAAPDQLLPSYQEAYPRVVFETIKRSRELRIPEATIRFIVECLNPLAEERARKFPAIAGLGQEGATLA